MQRILIALYALWKYQLNRFSKKNRKEESVTIVFNGIFGDAIILLSALHGYIELYSRKGRKVRLICRPVIKKFWDEIADLPKEVEIEEVDFKKFVESFSYYKNVVDKYSSNIDLLVAPGSSLSVDLFSTSVNAYKKVGLLATYKIRKPFYMALFKRLAYTDPVIPPKGTMMIQRQRYLLQHLGLLDFKGKLPTIKRQDRIITGDYCVICPGSSAKEKRWPTERFAEIADYIIEKYDWEIHVCGGADEIEDCNKMISLSKYPKRFVNHSGKTSFKEWSSIVEYAKIVIGNDSATMHFAAAHRVKAVCIAGVYNKFKFFPYCVDELGNNDFLPECANVDMPCEHCVPQGYHYGFNNPECKSMVENGHCALCVEMVTIEDVIQHITKLTDRNAV